MSLVNSISIGRRSLTKGACPIRTSSCLLSPRSPRCVARARSTNLTTWGGFKSHLRQPFQGTPFVGFFECSGALSRLPRSKNARKFIGQGGFNPRLPLCEIEELASRLAGTFAFLSVFCPCSVSLARGGKDRRSASPLARCRSTRRKASRWSAAEVSAADVTRRHDGPDLPWRGRR
jgi:hypothetical protein